MNSTARASETNDGVVENSANDNEPDKEKNHRGSGEIITDLDFFGAFSLVNVQLQWRDITADLGEEESDSDELWNSKEMFVEATELSSDTGLNDLSTPVVISITNFFVPLSALRTQDKADFTFNQSEQNAQTIAYIQNCGTYIKS